MTPEELRQANNEQMQLFFQGYDLTWRLTKILSFKMLLENKHDLAEYLKLSYDETFNVDDNYVDGPITNGLIYSALVELAMHIEDLLSLIEFIRSKEDFAKKITWYKASDISNRLLEKLKVELESSPEKISSRFLIPSRTHIEAFINQKISSEFEFPSLENYDFGNLSLVSYMNSAISAYEQIKGHYNQYKHGLKIRLQDMNSSLERRNLHTGTLSGDIISLHKDSLQEGLQSGRIGPGVLFPMHGPTVMQHFQELMIGKNLFQYDQFLSLPVDYLVNIAQKVMNLIFCLIKNRMDYCTPMLGDHRTICLPFPRDNFLYHRFCIGSVHGKLIDLDDFELLVR
jgi:hypothetical protein